MPFKPLGPCSFTNCPRRAVAGGRCELHQRPPQQRLPDRRASAASRGYDRSWQKLRAAHLKLEPNCRMCGAPGSHVDHILPKAKGGPDDETNLQTLCAAHHSMKTAREDGGYGNQRRR